MNGLWWSLPFAAVMLWCLVQFFRGGGPPSDDGRDHSTTTAAETDGH